MAALVGQSTTRQPYNWHDHPSHEQEMAFHLVCTLPVQSPPSHLKLLSIEEILYDPRREA